MVSVLIFTLIVSILIHDSDGSQNEKTKTLVMTYDGNQNAQSVPLVARDTISSDDDACNITTIISKPSGKIQSANYPQPYPTNCQWTYIVHVGDGHAVKVDVLTLDLNSEDTLVIMPNANSDTGLHQDSEESTSSNFEIVTACCESVIIQFTVGNHSNNHSGFIITFERNEQLDSTTTEPPSGGYSWHQVYLCGVTVLQFNSIKESFRESLISHAQDYFRKLNRTVENPSALSQTDVMITNVMHCPPSWPWSSNCVQVNFSVKEYQIPNIEWLFWFWIILISLLMVLFCLLLVIITKTKLIYYYFRRLKIPDFTDEMRNNIHAWRNQSSFMYPVFNAENSYRFKFLKEYERTPRPPVDRNEYQLRNEICTQSNGHVHNPPESIDHLDTDEHIYNTLTYK